MVKFSEWLGTHRDAAPTTHARIRTAMKRIPNVLDTELVACQKTLEQKISEQGPKPQRVDPHLISLARKELTNHRRTIKHYTHASTGDIQWYTNTRAEDGKVLAKLNTVAPLYREITSQPFKKVVGDALEVITYKCLLNLKNRERRFAFHGSFDLSAPKLQGCFKKTEPTQNISGSTTEKRADFILFGHNSGPICIECKNYREWIYPHHHAIKELIQKSLELGAIPLLIARRLHYTTLTNFLQPAGILAHESYFQYYPSDKAEIANRVKDKRSLGFTDVLATEEPHERTSKFFNELLPRINEPAADKFSRNKEALQAFVDDEINLAQLYNAIGSPAAGNWVEAEERAEEQPEHDLEF